MIYDIIYDVHADILQRQCLTVDYDAPAGVHEEIWSVALANGDIAVMLLNKSPLRRAMTLEWSMLGVSDITRFTVRDLWAHEDWSHAVMKQLTVVVPSHGVMMLRLAKVSV